MSKVYICAASPSHNYDSLEDQFDEVEVLVKGFVDITSAPQNLKKFYDKLKPTLDKTSSEDFLLLSGPSLLCVVITQFWLQQHGIVRLLTFDKTNRQYKEVTLINIQPLPNDGDKNNG